MTNSEVVKKIHGLFSENRFEEVLEHLADDIRVDSFATGMTFNGKNEFMGFMKGFKNAFPDMKLVHKNIFESGNQVSVEFNAVGKHTGPLMSPAGEIPATGKEVKLNVAEVMEVKNGKISAIRNYQDSASLMRQLGLM